MKRKMMLSDKMCEIHIPRLISLLIWELLEENVRFDVLCVCSSAILYIRHCQMNTRCTMRMQYRFDPPMTIGKSAQLYFQSMMHLTQTIFGKQMSLPLG